MNTETTLRDVSAPIGDISYIVSLGPVPANSDRRLLCPMRPRAILPNECDLRHGRDECPSDVSDSDCEGPKYIVKKGKNQRVSFDTDLTICYYRATIYFGNERSGFIPSPYSTTHDSFQRLPLRYVAGGEQERVDPAAMQRVNDSQFPIPDTRRGYESNMPFGPCSNLEACACCCTSSSRLLAISMSDP